MRNTIILSAVCFMAATPAFAQQDLPPGVPPSAIQPWQGGNPSLEPSAPRNTVAPGSLIDSEGGDAIPPLPIEPQMAGNVQYLSGGIGEEELAELQSEKHNYNVHVLMNEKSGAYVGGVTVQVSSGKNTQVFSAENVGPYLYFSLPPGHYTLTATSHMGEQRMTRFTVPAHASANLHLVFKG